MGIVEDAHAVLGPVHDESFAKLKASIKKHGMKSWQRRILVDQDGNVLDGRRRLQACRELGREDQLRFEKIECADDAARLAAMAIANQRRDLGVEQRRRWAQFLRDHGLSYEEIGMATGTSRDTARRDAPAPSRANAQDDAETRRTDSSGRNQPLHRATSEELRTRRDLIKGLYREGYSATKIAEHIGISRSQALADLRATGITPERRYSPSVPSNKPRAVVPVEPTADPRDRWRKCIELQRIEGFIKHLEGANTRASFAAIARDAHVAGDEEWLVGARETLNRLMTYLDDMEQAATSREVADRQHKDSDYRDDIGTPPAFRPRLVTA